MLRFAAIAAFLLLAACKQQTFDERYTAARQKLEAKAGAIDKDLAAAQSDAAEAGVIPTDAALPDLPVEPRGSAKPR